MSKKKSGTVMIVFGALCAITVVGQIFAAFGLLETEYYGIGAIFIYCVLAVVLLYFGLKRRQAYVSTTDGPISTSAPSVMVEGTGEARRLTCYALDAAERMGVDVTDARDVMEYAIGDDTDIRFSAGGVDDDSGLIVTNVKGPSVNVRYWRRRGAPTIEVDLDAETGEVKYLTSDGHRIV